MKKIILLLYLSLLYAGLNAQQQYKSVLDNGMVKWSFLDQRACADGFFYVQSTEIVAYGDTLFNDVMYKKLYLDSSFDSLNDAEESNTNWKNHTPSLYYEWENFFIRESKDASKLYIYSSNWWNNKEYLISDMSLQEGEIFCLSDDGGDTFELIVDSVYYENELKHIQWNFTDEWQHYVGPFIFIESIGSNMWFIYPDGCNRGTLGLNCFQNQTTFYKNDRIMLNFWDFADHPCGYYYSTIGINSINESNHHVFIQKDKIEIVFDSDMNVNISLYDLNGILHYERNLRSQNMLIPTAELPKGGYVLRVFDKNTNRLYTRKMIL